MISTPCLCLPRVCAYFGSGNHWVTRGSMRLCLGALFYELGVVVLYFRGFGLPIPWREEDGRGGRFGVDDLAIVVTCERGQRKTSSERSI